MKKLAALLLFPIIVMANTSHASAQTVEYGGAFQIIKLSNPCLQFFSLNDLTSGRFYPGGVGDNQFTGISYFFDNRFGEGYNYEGPYTDLMSDKFTNVSAGGVWVRNYSFDAKLRLINVQPKVIKAGTPFVRVLGAIRNFDGVSGCSITFRATYTKRP